MAQAYHHGALREALIASAEAILERDGIEALTLRAAARGAGVSHAAPSHHFGDLSGLLSALAASGFVRLREGILADAAAATPDPAARLVARGRAYVGFAQENPALFLLMFRSERLDWSCAALSSAGQAAFALLAGDDADAQAPSSDDELRRFVAATTRWSLLHGLAMLVVDGRLAALAVNVPGADMDTLIDRILTSGLRLAEPASPSHGQM